MTLDLQNHRPAPFDTPMPPSVRKDGPQPPGVRPSAAHAAATPTQDAPGAKEGKGNAKVEAARPVTPTPGMLLCKDTLDKEAVLTAVDCPHRLLLDQIADKWSVLILAALRAGPHRFNELKRRLDGVTQKALTQSLRRLERNGIVSRHVLATSPVAVEYAITPLGQTLKAPFEALYDWTILHLAAVEAARARFDGGGNAEDNHDTDGRSTTAEDRPATRD